MLCDIILLNFLKGADQYKAKKFEEVSWGHRRWRERAGRGTRPWASQWLPVWGLLRGGPWTSMHIGGPEKRGLAESGPSGESQGLCVSSPGTSPSSAHCPLATAGEGQILLWVSAGFICP